MDHDEKRQFRPLDTNTKYKKVRVTDKKRKAIHGAVNRSPLDWGLEALAEAVKRHSCLDVTTDEVWTVLKEIS